MSFDPILADIRFGCGLSPTLASPQSAAQMLENLHGPDLIAVQYPIETFPVFRERVIERTALRRDLKANRGTAKSDDIRQALARNNRAGRRGAVSWLAAHLQRRTRTTDGFRERLEFFWGDHFTATGKAGVLQWAGSPYTESAVRPFVAGKFEDLLISAATHPLMVHYLDQAVSAGPNSKRAKRKPGQFGLNENLAREILELHTLGVDGPYTQDDVRQLAELLAGLTHSVKEGRKFRKDFAEPGAETVLGVRYGSPNRGLADIETALRDLARHPATARHLSTKLAVHFVSDTPDPALIKAMTAVYHDTDGDLTAVYRTMLTHPSVWAPAPGNIKLPFDYISSACRALDVMPRALRMKEKTMRRRIYTPLQLMGHQWQRPDGPDGLEELDAAWITPQGMAARLQWAIAIPQLLRPKLPDPREFLTTALGPMPPERVAFAAEAAESRADGIGLILASPAFQRR
ncbi:MAG: DUF1800 domain-containing protein [Pelagimonas sp.]